MEIHAGNFPFSLLSLLSLIRGTSVETVRIRVGHQKESLNAVSLHPEYAKIKEMYKKGRYDLKRDGKDSLLITRC